jgi:hypothetical protein
MIPNLKATQASIPLAIALLFASPSNTRSQDQSPPLPHRIYEAQPSQIAQSTARFARQVAMAAPHVGAVPHYFVVPAARRWWVGQTLTIAFNGGDDNLYAQIEQAASVWIQPGFANLKFNFKDSNGHYRHWTVDDTNRAADIRIAFISDKTNGGYWSVIGRDSIDETLKGGKPYQPSMNFGGFDKTLPADWAGTVRHEFGHALGFEHEHQSPAAGCDFRFDNDPGYVKTLDSEGWYTNDGAGRRPGLYTYLGGKENYWLPSEVDFNLKSIPTTSAFAVGPFDKRSIMKYYFDPSMFKAGARSPCFSPSENEDISPQDKLGVSIYYPTDPAVVALVNIQNIQALKELVAAPGLSATVKSGLDGRLEAAQQASLVK